MRSPWESLQVSYIFSNWILLQKKVKKKVKKNKCSDKNSPYTDVVLENPGNEFGCFIRRARSPKKKKIQNRRCFIFLFFVFEIGSYHARSTDFEEKIEALWTGYDKKNFFLAEDIQQSPSLSLVLFTFDLEQLIFTAQ